MYAHTMQTLSGEVVDLDEYDPNVVASLLKQYLRELPDPLVSPRIMAKLEAAAGMYVCVCACACVCVCWCVISISISFFLP